MTFNAPMKIKQNVVMTWVSLSRQDERAEVRRQANDRRPGAAVLLRQIRAAGNIQTLWGGLGT
jgi:hypothetical protein